MRTVDINDFISIRMAYFEKLKTRAGTLGQTRIIHFALGFRPGVSGLGKRSRQNLHLDQPLTISIMKNIMPKMLLPDNERLSGRELGYKRGK